MLAIALLQMALTAFSLIFGSLGVFFLYLSFLQPACGAHALIFLGAASTIVWFMPPK
ncbi:MAG TPA: hypothetical protein VKQ73_14045 [Stellaceae bacterium]|nr:hypothetical protein [Stellaceae bacterium]